MKKELLSKRQPELEDLKIHSLFILQKKQKHALEREPSMWLDNALLKRLGV